MRVEGNSVLLSHVPRPCNTTYRLLSDSTSESLLGLPHFHSPWTENHIMGQKISHTASCHLHDWTWDPHVEPHLYYSYYFHCVVI